MTCLDSNTTATRMYCDRNLYKLRSNLHIMTDIVIENGRLKKRWLKCICDRSITASDRLVWPTDNRSEIFVTDFFGHKIFLTDFQTIIFGQSPHWEISLTENIWSEKKFRPTFRPTFRSQKGAHYKTQMPACSDRIWSEIKDSDRIRPKFWS